TNISPYYMSLPDAHPIYVRNHFQRFGMQTHANIKVHQRQTHSVKILLQEAAEQVVQILREGLQLGGTQILGRSQFAEFVLHHHADRKSTRLNSSHVKISY